MSAAWQTVVVSVVPGAGTGLAHSSLPAPTVGAVDPSQTGAANGLNILMRSIGTSVSSAVIGTAPAPTSVRSGGVEVPSTEGFRISFAIAAGAALVGLLLAAFLPPRRNTARRELRAAQTPRPDTGPPEPRTSAPRNMRRAPTGFPVGALRCGGPVGI
ncbi:hypothetical protein GCM10010446_38930 [Streptomyces enissocaesilis]|uniref:Major facilitator superfamily (MFS) profile domain-containing protein n=1 Tax=Streptomyces enissocaesilis TaxID=332589 RepID=A0ABN3XEA6_9ACTN